MQNLGNKRFTSPPCARSLSLKELRAKSREHGSYAWGATVLRPISELAETAAPSLRSRLSKIDDYLSDNISCIRLSDTGDGVNDKAGCGTEKLGNQSRFSETADPEAWGTREGFGNVYQSHRFLRVRTSTNRIRIIAAIAKSSLPLSIFTFYARNRPRSRTRDLRCPVAPKPGLLWVLLPGFGG